MKEARDSIDHTMSKLGVELLVMPSDSTINTISSAVGLSPPGCVQAFLRNREIDCALIRVSYRNHASGHIGLQRQTLWTIGHGARVPRGSFICVHESMGDIIPMEANPKTIGQGEDELALKAHMIHQGFIVGLDSVCVICIVEARHMRQQGSRAGFGLLPASSIHITLAHS